MEKREFKIGDKVKIPKTKSKDLATSLKDCAAIKKAKNLKQDYLYINKIREDEYDLGAELSSLDSTFGLQDLEHYKEDELVLPECWFVLYNTKEEFDIINKFYDKNWIYCISKNKNGYHNNGDYQIESNNWVGSGKSAKEKLLEKGYVQITFQQFQKYVLKQETMEKEIIGYKLIKPEYEGALKNIQPQWNKKIHEEKGYNVAINSGAYYDFKNAGVLKLWFEPVYEEEFKVGDWVTVTEVEGDGWLNYCSQRTFKLEKVPTSYWGGIYWGVYEGGLHAKFRKATFEEIKAAQKTIIKMYSSNKGMFEIEVVAGKAYYRPENKELPKEWIRDIINSYDDILIQQRNGVNPYNVKIAGLHVGCYQNCKKEDWEKVYKLLK